MIEDLQGLLTIMGMLIEAAGLGIVGREWINALAGGVKGLTVFQTRWLIRQAHRMTEKRAKIAETMKSPKFLDYYTSEFGLAAMRAQSKQQDGWTGTAGQRTDCRPVLL